MKKLFTVYMHISPSNKYYIGVTSKNVLQRWGNGGIRYKSNDHFWRAIQKYEWENFNHIILAEKLEKEEAYNLEIQYIKLYNSSDLRYGYNKSTGGEHSNLGVKYSESVKQKLSDIHKSMGVTEAQLAGLKKHWEKAKGVPRSDEVKAKISASNTGKKRTPEQIANNVNARVGKYTGLNSKLYGRHLSTATKNKIRQAALNQFENGMPDETRKKISDNNARYWKGKQRSEETKQKLRNAALKQFENGVPQEIRDKLSAAHKGKKDSPETREKKRIAALKREAKKRGELYECE